MLRQGRNKQIWFFFKRNLKKWVGSQVNLIFMLGKNFKSWWGIFILWVGSKFASCFCFVFLFCFLFLLFFFSLVLNTFLYYLLKTHCTFNYSWIWPWGWGRVSTDSKNLQVIITQSCDRKIGIQANSLRIEESLDKEETMWR